MSLETLVADFCKTHKVRPPFTLEPRLEYNDVRVAKGERAAHVRIRSAGEPEAKYARYVERELVQLLRAK